MTKHITTSCLVSLFLGLLFHSLVGIALASEISTSALAQQTGVEKTILTETNTNNAATLLPSLLSSSSSTRVVHPNTFVISQANDGSSKWYWYLVGSKNNILLEMLAAPLQQSLTFDNDTITNIPITSADYFYSSVTEAVKAIESVKTSSSHNDNFVFDLKNQYVLLAESTSTPPISSESFNAQVIEISMTNSRQKTSNTRTRRRMKMGAITMSAEVDTTDDDGENNAGVESQSTTTTTTSPPKSKRKIIGFIRDHHTPMFPLHSQSFLESPSYQSSIRQTIQHAISLSSILIINANTPSTSSPSADQQQSSSDDDGSIPTLRRDTSVVTPSLAVDMSSIERSTDLKEAMQNNMAALSSLDARVNRVAEMLVYICMLLITFAVSLIVGGVLWRKYHDFEKQKDYDMMMETV